VSKMVKKLLMQVRTEIHCVMPGMPFQKDITDWYLEQDDEKNERLGCSKPQQCCLQGYPLLKKRQKSNAGRLTISETQRYFVKYTSQEGTQIQAQDPLFFVPRAISRLFFPHIQGDIHFSMSAVCVESMMSAIVRNSAQDFWDLTVSELIQLLRASRSPKIKDFDSGAMKHVHDCVAKILNWRILQAYDVSAAEDFMQVSFLLSAEDGVDIAWSQWNMGRPVKFQSLALPFGTYHTADEDKFHEQGIIIDFGSYHTETMCNVAVDMHLARLRSFFIQGLLSFPSYCNSETKLPRIDLTKICTKEAQEVFLKFFVYYHVPESVSIECALQLWEVSEWMQVRKSTNHTSHTFQSVRCCV
jgi:hypothetical protein